MDTWDWQSRLLGLSHDHLSRNVLKLEHLNFFPSFPSFPISFIDTAFFPLAPLFPLNLISWKVPRIWLPQYFTTFLLPLPSGSPCHLPCADLLPWWPCIQTIDGSLLHIRWRQTSKSQDVRRLGLGYSHRFPFLYSKHHPTWMTVLFLLLPLFMLLLQSVPSSALHPSDSLCPNSAHPLTFRSLPHLPGNHPLSLGQQ